MLKIYIIGGFLAAIVLYKLLTLFIFLILRSRLEHGNFDSFTKILGEKYQHRRMMNGLKRCKWSKAWINVKASFDENGNLVYKKIHPDIISKFKSEISFTL